MGWYHHFGHRDYEGALREFGIAVATEPNNSFYVAAEGAIYKRTGNWEAAAERASRASDLDPLSAAPAAEAGYPYTRLRRYSEAERYLGRFATITGEYDRLAYVHLLRDGDPAALRAWVHATLGAGALPRLIATAANMGSGPSDWSSALVRALCGQCDAAIPLVPSHRERDWRRNEGIAQLHERAGRADEARAHYDSARVGSEALSIHFGDGGNPSPSGEEKVGEMVAVRP
jgi:tetratricopeptide (TPR) repeat protein